MDFSLSAEEQATRDWVRTFVQREILPLEPAALRRERNHQPGLTKEEYRGLVDKVSADVKNAIVDVQTNWDQIISARRWRLSAEEEVRRLEADRKARPEGMSPSLIQTELDAQLRLAEARRQEVAAMAGYSASLAALEQAKGTLLRYDNVVMDEEPEPTVPLTWDKPHWPWDKK